MVGKDKGSASSSGAASGRRGRKFGILLLLAIPLLAILAAIFGARALYEVWFPGNEHLVLRRLEIASRGYWHGRENELLRRLGLRPGTALFAR